jgi:hypothetical protein
MTQDPFWFFKKWNIEPTQSIMTKVEELEEKYSSLLVDVKRLEEENIETTNALYEIENRLQEQIDNLVYKNDNYV